jgi:tripartite-type tricarboxylate transporter receptor subunit TctC
MISRRTFAAGWAALAIAFMGSGAVLAADPWPLRPVKLVVPSVPGGLTDTMGRLLAQHLTERLGQSFVIENRAGAGGLIGAEVVARSAPDGYTFGISAIATHVLAPVMSTTATFDAIKDFTHIAVLGGPPNVLIVGNPVPAKSLKEFLDLTKVRPGGISYGSPGVGSVGHLTGELLAQIAGLPLAHVPYRGGAPALADVMGNHVPSAIVGLTTPGEQIRSGAVRAIAITGQNRLPDYPEIPTFAELGFPALVVTNWLAVSGPANLPEDIARKLNAEIIRVLRLPAVRERLLRDAIDPEPLEPQAVTDFVRTEIARWTPIVRATGAKLE